MEAHIPKQDRRQQEQRCTVDHVSLRGVFVRHDRLRTIITLVHVHISYLTGTLLYRATNEEYPPPLLVLS
jgi:hypothetical protein